MKAKAKYWLNVLVFLAMVAGMVLPTTKAQAAGTTVYVDTLDPSWTAPGGGGVFSAYIGPTAYGYVSPGSTALIDGREAGIIKAGLAVDPTSLNYEDEGIFGFQPGITINTLAAGLLTYDVENQYGPNPVWMTIEIDTGVTGVRDDNVTYQFVPTTNPSGWHTVDAAAGFWQKWNNNNGDVTGNPLISLSAVATAHNGLNIVRVFLRLGMGNSYHGTGEGTIGWVDKVTINTVTYDFVAVTKWYVGPSGNDGNTGTLASPFLTIQHAIDAATPGDTVHLLAGTYNVSSTILANKSITITGPVGGGAIVQGTNSAVLPVFEISASNITLQNLEITHNSLPVFNSSGWLELPNSLVEIPISLGLSGLTISNNQIYVPAQSGTMSTWNGVGITVGTGTTTGISITGNTIHNLRDGLVVQYNNFANINNNVIYDTKGGIMNYTNNQADANNRTMLNNSWGTAHNEWDIVWNSGSYYLPDSYHDSVLVLSQANNNAYVLDRRAADAASSAALIHNRSHIFVNIQTGTLVKGPANGNKNLPYATIELANEAVIEGGTVYVTNPLPPLPSDFFGFLYFNDNAPTEGMTINAYVPGVSDRVGHSSIITDPETHKLAYQIDIPAATQGQPKDGGVEGDLITFKIGTRVVATSTWHGGTNVQVDFHPPQAVPGTYSGAVGAAVAFTASANDFGSDVSTYQWDWDSNGTYDASGQTASHTWDTVGTKHVTLKVTDAQGGEGFATTDVAIGKGTATITLGSLNPTYDGTPKAATATTVPSGLTVTFTYDGSSTAPMAAGSYAVVATIVDANYEGTATGTLVIATAGTNATLAISNPSVPYNGAQQAATVEIVTSSVSGSVLNVRYDGSLTAPTNAKAYVVTADFVPTDPNYSTFTGLSAGTFTITKIDPTPTFTITNNHPAYDGTDKTPDITLGGTPGDLSLVRYNGGTALPHNAGSYVITATFTPHDPINYNTLTGTTVGTFVIDKINPSPTFTITNTPATYNGNSITPIIAKGGTPGELSSINYNGSPNPPSDAGSYNVTADFTPAEPTNYNTLVNVTIGTFVINQATPTITLSNLTQIYDGSPKNIGISTMPINLAAGAIVTYDPAVHTAPGTYAVTVTINETNYSGSASGTLTILARHGIGLEPGWNLVSFNVHPQSTAIANVLSSISGKYDLVYAWDKSGNSHDSGNWQKYAPLAPAYQNTLATLDESMGIWIHITQAATLNVDGFWPTTHSIDVTTNAYTNGWNLVSYPSTHSDLTPASVLTALGTNYSLVYAYHAADSDHWKLYDRTAPAFANDLTLMQPGWGYWIKVSVTGTVTVTIAY
jgi:hypothetical protein